MNRFSLRRRVAAATVAVVLGAAGALATSSSAMAASNDVLTPGWEWYDADDNAAYFSDASAYFVDYLGSSVDVFGFTDDAFDGFLLDDLSVTLGGATLSPAFTSTAGTWVDNGLSEFEATASADFGDGDVLDITRTLEIQGSFARWSWTATTSGGAPLADYTIDQSGELGSDSDSEFVTPTATTLVSHDGPDGDPVIGYSFADVAYSVSNGSDVVELSFTGDAAAVLTVALLEYDPCSTDEALAAMQAMLPTLAASFGETLPPVYADDCLYVDAPAMISGETDQLLPLLENSGLDDWDYIYEGAIDDGLTFTVLDAPAGLTFALEVDPESGEPALRMTGTPAESGEVRLLFYFDDYAPLVLTFDVVVEDEEELAATGAADIAPIVAGAAGLFLGVGALLLVLRRRAAID